jgi:hypothetical protein
VRSRSGDWPGFVAEGELGVKVSVSASTNYEVVVPGGTGATPWKWLLRSTLAQTD